jgi:KAP family P-loop domain
MATAASATRQRFPRFMPERGRVGDRRERWWFSGGSAVNQGKTSAVVGAVWTHWLADRQVPSTSPYDEAFAFDLFHDTQRQSGQEIDDSAGAQVADCVPVLRSRGLLADCSSCQTIESVKEALLGYGPVVAGLNWRESMFQPDRQAGPPVCRAAPESPVVGGHAVLMDGISLDLELDGVTGFIRFKNSWGSDWGENGLCLISIDDVEALFDSGEFYLPVPAAGPAEAPEDPSALVFPSETPGATAAPQPEREPIHYEQQPIGSDRYTIVDTIGYAAYATAIAQGIQHHQTKPPLSIGIKAPWGAGKTSLMRMIQRRLEWPQNWGTTLPDAELPKVRLGGDEEPLTNGSLLRLLSARRRARTSGARPATQRSADTPDDPLWRPTIWFNPWMYQSGEQIWAGFANEIIKQITTRLPTGDREQFWLELNLTRVDEQAVRRKVYSLILGRVLPWALGAAVLVVAGLGALAAGVMTAIGAALTAAGSGALVLSTAGQSVRVFGANIAGPLRRAVEPSAAITNLGAGAVSGTLEQVVRDPGYAARSGFFQLMREDVQNVINLVATEDRPLVIFVDDLDRCSPGTVVQVMEAINLFLAGEFANAVFVIAVEPEMVAAHIEVAYRDLAANFDTQTGSKGEGDTLGWRFLEKFIQLPLTLPMMEPERAEAFVGALLSSEAGAVTGNTDETTAEPPTALESAASVAGARGILSQKSLSESVHLASSLSAASAVGQAFPQAVADKLSAASPEMRRVIDYGADFLRGNPRELKRYVNVFRFLVMLSTTRPHAQGDPSDQLTALAKLAVLTTRWPSAVSHLTWPLDPGGKHIVFDLLEDPPRSSANSAARRATADLSSLTRALTGCGLGDAAVKRLLDEDLRRLMCTEPRIGSSARTWL